MILGPVFDRYNHLFVSTAPISFFKIRYWISCDQYLMYETFQLNSKAIGININDPLGKIYYLALYKAK